MKIAIINSSKEQALYINKCLDSITNTYRYCYIDWNCFILSTNKIKYDIIIIEFEFPNINTLKEIKLLNTSNVYIILTTNNLSINILKEGYKYNIYRIMTYDNIEHELKDAIYTIRKDFNKEIIYFKVGKEQKAFLISEIMSIYSEGHYINIMLKDRIYKSRNSLKLVSEYLQDSNFIKVNCNTYVNLNNIEYFDTKIVRLVNRKFFPISNTYYKQMLKKCTK